MKKFFTFLFVSSLLLACSGERGPQGPPGPTGNYIVGSVFEIENVDFHSGNSFSFFANFNNFTNVPIYNSDIVLIYLWEGMANGQDIWSLMPQTFYFSDGAILEYNFNHTQQDFEIYLNGNVNFNALSAAYTQNQIFRIAIMPADFAENNNIDVSNFYEVMDALEISSETEIPTLQAME